MAALLSPIKDVHSERRLFLARVILAAVISIVLLGIVVARLVQLQVVDHELFAEKSQGNRVRIDPLPPEAVRKLLQTRRQLGIETTNTLENRCGNPPIT